MGREWSIAQPSLYDTDFYGWTGEQVKRQRSGDLRAIDVANIAEELHLRIQVGGPLHRSL